MMMAPIDRKPVSRHIPPMDGPLAPHTTCKPPKPDPHTIMSPARVDELVFAKKDRNGDSQLSLDEWVRSTPGEVTFKEIQQFQRYDRNDDGQVSKDEFMKGRAIDRWMRSAFDGVKDTWHDHVLPLGNRLFGQA